MGKQRWMALGWVAFLAAALLQVLVFAAFDPQDMQWPGLAAGLSRTALYSLAFFVVWGVTALAGYVTLWLAGPAPASAGS